MRFAQKAAVTEFATEEEVFSLTDFFYGKSYSWMVTTIGQNPEYGAELLVFNLGIDPDELLRLSDDELADRLAETPKPVRAMRTNASPVVLAYDDAPDALREDAPTLDILQARAAQIRENSDFAGRLISAFLATRDEREPSVHVEEQIYDGFTDNADLAVMERFHASEWGERAGLLPLLADERLRSLGQRLIFVEAPQTMHDAARRDYEMAIARRLMEDDGTVPWLTLHKAIEEANDMIAVAEGAERALLTDLRDYLVQRVDNAAALLA